MTENPKKGGLRPKKGVPAPTATDGTATDRTATVSEATASKATTSKATASKATRSPSKSSPPKSSPSKASPSDVSSSSTRPIARTGTGDAAAAGAVDANLAAAGAPAVVERTRTG